MKDKCTLTNEELIIKSNEWISLLAKTGGKSWALCVPVNFNRDPDMIFSEVNKRLKYSYQREIHFSGGIQTVSVGDEFNWSGTFTGRYKVLAFADAVIYSPSGLGGTPTIIVKNLDTHAVDEWCGDSVANGIYSTLKQLLTP